MMFKVSGDGRGADLLPFHAGKKGPKTSQGQPGVERCARAAHDIAPMSQLFDLRRIRCHDRATDDIGMAIEIFGGRMDHEIGTERDRLLERR